jgi:predicted transcriptional regulator
VEVAGIEPDTPCAESLVSIKDSEFTIEALIEILTNISGTDRQILTQLVQRWGSLSDELKEAVLRVVG